MTRPVHLALPGSIERRTGGTIYDRRIVEGLHAAGRSVVVHELSGRFPRADGQARAAAADVVRVLPAGAILVIDGLALPAFEGSVEGLPPDWIALIHHPLALETGLAAADAARLERTETHLLSLARRIVVTSEQTARDIGAYGVDASRVGVVLPGTDPAPLASGSGGPGLAMLAVGALIRRKGHAVLIEALAAFRELDWQLTCVGDAERDPATVGELRAAIARFGLEGRVALVGECAPADLQRLYQRADLFVLASHHEGYGMALAEALARGLPIVSTTAGAIPGTVPEDAGLLVPPGNVGAFAEALRQVLSEPGLRQRLATGARQARDQLPTWATACRRFEGELAKLESACR